MEKNTNQKATIVITYNGVTGYAPGTYEGRNGPVIVHSHDNTASWDSMAENKLSQIMHGIYGRIDPKDVKQVYLYVGLNAKEGALRAAESLSHRGNNLSLVACNCDSDEKSARARRMGVPLIWSECRGNDTLGDIVRKALA